MALARLLGAALLVLSQAGAAEYAVLTTGFRLACDRYEASGPAVRLFTKDGVTELPASAIVRFEQGEYVPPAPKTELPAPPTQSPKELIEQAAKQYGTNPEFVRLVHSVARVESGYRPNAVSPKGAIGLMQLMPQTARVLGVDPNKPEQNADGGARYLSELLVRYKGHTGLALAAYNAGPGAVERYKGIPPYRETIQYVQKVLKHYSKSGKWVSKKAR